MSKRKPSLIVVIAEGISDEDALYPNLKKVSKKLKVHFEFVGGDVFTARKNQRKPAKAIIGDIIREEIISKPEFEKEDIKLIVQLTDTDGVYISDDNIVIDESQSDRTEYTLENIRVDSLNQLQEIKNRNYVKRRALDILSTTGKVTERFNYKILYFSRNLDHVISDNPDTLKSEKSKAADAFSNSFTTANDFEKFFSASDFTVDGTYDETWTFIKSDAKSLKKFTNFHLIFEMLREITNNTND